MLEIGVIKPSFHQAVHGQDVVQEFRRIAYSSNGELHEFVVDSWRSELDRAGSNSSYRLHFVSELEHLLEVVEVSEVNE